MVQHLEPHNLQFAIATSLLVVFILMVTPLAKLLKHWKAAWVPKQGVREPLLPERGDEKGEPLLSEQRITTCKLPYTPRCWWCSFSWSHLVKVLKHWKAVGAPKVGLKEPLLLGSGDAQVGSQSACRSSVANLLSEACASFLP